MLYPATVETFAPERETSKVALLPFYWFGWRVGHALGECVSTLRWRSPDLRETRQLVLAPAACTRAAVAPSALPALRPVATKNRSLSDTYRAVKELPITKRLVSLLVGGPVRSEVLLTLVGLALLLAEGTSIAPERLLLIIADIVLLLAELVLALMAGAVLADVVMSAFLILRAIILDS
jgi:hypothetical protein